MNSSDPPPANSGQSAGSGPGESGRAETPAATHTASPLDALKSGGGGTPSRFESAGRFDPQDRNAVEKAADTIKSSIGDFRRELPRTSPAPEATPAAPDTGIGDAPLEFQSKDKGNYAFTEQTSSQLLAALVQLLSRPQSVTNIFHEAAQVIGTVNGDAGFNSAPGGPQVAPPPPVLAQAPRGWPHSAFDACKGNAHAVAFLVTIAVLEGENIISISQCAGDLSSAMIRRRQLMQDGTTRAANTGGSPDIEADIDPARDVYSKFDAFAVEEFEDQHGAMRLRFIDPNGARKVLSHALAYLGAIHFWTEDFSGWLTRLGKHPSLFIRRKAGAAAAAIATLSSKLDSSHLRAWLTGDTVDECDALDAAFAVLLSQEALKPAAMNEMSRWADGGEGGDGWFAVFHLAGNLAGEAQPSFSYGLLRRMLNAREAGHEMGQVWAVRGLARVMWLAYSAPERLPAVTTCFADCIGDATKRRDWSARAQIYEAAILAASQGIGQRGPHELTQFESCMTDPVNSGQLAPLYRKLSTIGEGVNVRWRKMLGTLNQRAMARGRAFEQEPFWVFCRALYLILDEEADRQIWRERLSDWANLARAKHPSSPPGAARLLAMLETGNGQG